MNPSASSSALQTRRIIDQARQLAETPLGVGKVGVRDRAETVATEFAGRRPRDIDALRLAEALADFQFVCEAHRGGQGVVYQAVRIATGEDVAIKVPHDRTLAIRRERERFEREAAILRELDHPNIVPFEDIGVADGRPYLVMPFIFGSSLDEFVANNGLSVRETLRLFAKVCDAVHAAHLKGVIHRDLKPGNVRVDDSGEPFVIDFGLAKQTSSSHVAVPPPSSTMTEPGRLLGTLFWTSPEQAEARPGGVDVRTDVYSLGVILYQLLTGRLPLDVTGSMRDVLNRIVAVEPPSPRTIRPEIDDEVATIIRTCMSKEANRRYQIAGDIAADVRRYLSGEAIHAKRDSYGYMLRKSLRRYWIPLAIGGAFLLASMVGGVVSLVFWQNAERHARKAEAERVRANESTRAALKFASAVSVLIQRPDPRLLAQDPNAVAAMAAIDALAADLLRNPSQDALTEIELLNVIFHIYTIADRIEDAEPLARRVIFVAEQTNLPPDVRVAAAWHTVMSYYGHLDDFDAAAQAAEQALLIFRSIHGADHPATIYPLGVYGSNLFSAGRDAEAERVLKQVLHLTDLHPQEVPILKGLAEYLFERGEFERALDLQERSLVAARRIYPPGDRNLAHHLHSIGVLYLTTGRILEAECVAREAYEIRRETEDGPIYLPVTKSLLGATLIELGRFSEAEPLLNEAIAEFDPWRVSAHTRDVGIEMAERLARLYERWNESEPDSERASRAAHWRDRFNELSETALP